jgi:hypothetical protein
MSVSLFRFHSTPILDVTTCIKAMWAIQIKWENIHAKTKNRIFQIIYAERTNLTVRTFFSLFYSLSHIGVTYDDLSTKFEVLTQSDEKMKKNGRKKNSEYFDYFSETKSLKEILLIGIEIFSNTMQSRQISHLFYILRTQEIPLSTFTVKTRKNIYQRISLFSAEFSIREMKSVLFGLSDWYGLERIQKNRTEKEIKLGGENLKFSNENDVEEVEKNNVKNVLKLMAAAVTRLCVDFDGNDAQSVTEHLRILNILHDIDLTTRNTLYNKILSVSTSIPTAPSSFQSSSTSSLHTITDDNNSCESNGNENNGNENENEEDSEGNVSKIIFTKNDNIVKKTVEGEMERLMNLKFENMGEKEEEKQEEKEVEKDGEKEGEVVNVTKNQNVRSTTSHMYSIPDNINNAQNNQLPINKYSQPFKSINEIKTEIHEKETAVRTAYQIVRAFDFVRVLAASGAEWRNLRYEVPTLFYSCLTLFSLTSPFHTPLHVLHPSHATFYFSSHFFLFLRLFFSLFSSFFFLFSFFFSFLVWITKTVSWLSWQVKIKKKKMKTLSKLKWKSTKTENIGFI